MFKKILKGDIDYDNISRRLYGTPDKAGNLSKINNNTDGYIIAPVDDEFEAEGEGIRCNIDGTVYHRFYYYLLINMLGAVKGVILDFDSNPDEFNFKRGQGISVYDNENLFLSGYISDIVPRNTNSGCKTRLYIMSSAGILLETVVPEPLNFSYLSPKSIIQTICDYFGLSVEFEDNLNLDYVSQTPIGNSYAADEEETCWDFMVRIASSRGFIIDDDGTKLHVKTIRDNDAKMSFLEGDTVGVTDWKAEFSTDELARYYVALTQYPEPAQAIAEIPYDLPVTKRIKADDAYSGSLDEFANWYACRSIGDAIKIKLSVNDFFNLQKGDFVYLLSPSCYIFEETKMIVEEFEQDGDNGNSITLTLPCAYTGVIPESLPLC